MNYFKNTELADLYKISEKSVRNWIDAAEAGKIDLQLVEVNGRKVVANTTHNGVIINELVQRGKKYKNTRAYKVIEPQPAFYELYNSRQIFEIISSLNTNRELPLQYNYLPGADDWDKYVERLSTESSPNMLTACKELLQTNLDSIDRLINNHPRVNLIDLGFGNCMPVKGIVEHLIKKGSLNRYIGIDISKTMIDIGKHNMSEWFGKSANMEFYERDISRDEFGDLLAADYFSNKDIPLNIVLLLGGTIANFEVPADVLRTIRKSMQPQDLFVSSLKLDTANSRQYFDLNPNPAKAGAPQIAGWHRYVLDLLNIRPDLYDVEQVFDEKKKARFIGAKLKVDISIKFNLNQGEHVIHLRKGETINVLRYLHQTAMDVVQLFHENGFDCLQASKTRDHEYFLIVSEIEKNHSKK